jgi:putative oxidoreductase
MRRLGSYAHWAPLLLRLGIGLTFFFAGLGKVLGGTDRVAGFFGSLGVPLPGVMAPFISYLELLGGLALILGVFTRVFSLLFVGDMLVALLLVGLPTGLGKGLPAGFSDMRTELLLLLGSLALALLGPGLLSLDAAFLGERPERLVNEPAPAATRARSTGV